MLSYDMATCPFMAPEESKDNKLTYKTGFDDFLAETLIVREPKTFKSEKGMQVVYVAGGKGTAKFLGGQLSFERFDSFAILNGIEILFEPTEDTLELIFASADIA